MIRSCVAACAAGMPAARAAFFRAVTVGLAASLVACGGGGGSGGDGGSASNPATATTLNAPAVQVQQTGEAYALSIGSTSAGLSYQWQRSTDGGTVWVDVGPNATSAPLYAFNADDLAMDGDQYRIRVSDGSSSGVSAPITIHVQAQAPVIQTQPQSSTSALGGGVTFSVDATGPSRSYRWQSSDDGVSSQDVSGGTGRLLTVAAPTAADNGRRYRVIVSTSMGSVTSDEAVLTTQRPIASVYVLHQGDHKITRFSVYFDGTLEPVLDHGAIQTTTLSDTPLRAQLSPTGNRLVVSTGLTLNVLSLDADGTLRTPFNTVNHTWSSPYNILVSPDGVGVYGLSPGDATAQYQITNQGLEMLSPSKVTAPFATGGFIVASGNFAVVAEPNADRISTYAIASDRTLGSAPVSSLTGAGYATFVVPSATGTRLYAQTDGRGSPIRQYGVDATGTVTALSPAEVTGGGNGQPVVTPDGHCLFAPRRDLYVTPSAGWIGQFQINGDGTLVAASPASVTIWRGLSAIAVTPDSRYLLATHYADGLITIYRIGTSCDLSQVGGALSTQGSQPALMVVKGITAP